MCSANAASAMAQFGLSTVEMGVGYNALENQDQASRAMTERNAAIASGAATDALQRGERAAGDARLKAGLMRGEQRAAFASAGVDLGSGTALDVLADSAGMSELDAQTLRANAAREAWGYKAQGAQIRAQGEIDRQKNEGEKAATILGGFSGMLGSASKGWGK